MKIQANATGTRSIEITDRHLETIDRYSLFDGLIDSNGIIDETVLDKLKLNVRSILNSQTEVDKDLLDLCLDVIYNSNMKAMGLQQLLKLKMSLDLEAVVEFFGADSIGHTRSCGEPLREDDRRKMPEKNATD